MEYIATTTDLTKKFGNRNVVNAINMHIKQGDIYGFIGRNGAGKTTTMKLMLGLLNPTSGSMTLFDEKDLNKGRRRIGSLIEAPGLYKNATAFENMKRFSILYGGTDEEIKEILTTVGLQEAMHKKAGHFSLGMRQRLGIGIALLGHPEFLVLDEPINGLDPAGIKEIRDIIHHLNSQGITFLISSHLLDELGKIATVYGIVNDGELVEEVGAEELKARCRNNLMIKTSNLSKAEKILAKEKLLGHYEIKEDALYLYENLDKSARINELLVLNGLRVHELSISSSGFEDYFIERIGR